MNDCLFCAFSRGEQHCHKVWEDARHLAFLTIFPNTPGATVVIPRAHFQSNALTLPDDVLTGLVLAAKRVAGIIDRAFPNVGRTALAFEGFGVDHVHAKLFPLHGTRQDRWEPIRSNVHSFTPLYRGFVATHDGPRVPDADLALLADHIRNA
ncbi:MAG: HIT family protein [Candidatus Uhrbacteria bacterium]